MKYVVSSIAVLLIGVSTSFSQPLPPPVPQSYYPIDGVVALLLLLGLFYGAYSLYKTRSQASAA